MHKKDGIFRKKMPSFLSDLYKTKDRRLFSSSCSCAVLSPETSTKRLFCLYSLAVSRYCFGVIQKYFLKIRIK